MDPGPRMNKKESCKKTMIPHTRIARADEMGVVADVLLSANPHFDSRIKIFAVRPGRRTFPSISIEIASLRFP